MANVGLGAVINRYKYLTTHLIMFSYIAIAGAAYTAHKLLYSTATFINSISTISSVTYPAITSSESSTIEDYEGLLKVGMIMVSDFSNKKKRTKIGDAKLELCRKSIHKLETSISIYNKAKKDYESNWFNFRKFDDHFYTHRMFHNATLLRLRLRWIA